MATSSGSEALSAVIAARRPTDDRSLPTAAAYFETLAAARPDVGRWLANVSGGAPDEAAEIARQLEAEYEVVVDPRSVPLDAHRAALVVVDAVEGPVRRPNNRAADIRRRAQIGIALALMDDPRRATPGDVRLIEQLLRDGNAIRALDAGVDGARNDALVAAWEQALGVEGQAQPDPHQLFVPAREIWQVVGTMQEVPLLVQRRLDLLGAAVFEQYTGPGAKHPYTMTVNDSVAFLSQVRVRTDLAGQCDGAPEFVERLAGALERALHDAGSTFPLPITLEQWQAETELHAVLRREVGLGPSTRVRAQMVEAMVPPARRAEPALPDPG